MRNTGASSREFCGLFGKVELKANRQPRRPAIKQIRRTTRIDPMVQAKQVREILEEYYEDKGIEFPRVEAYDFMRANAGASIVMPILSVVERMIAEDKIVRSIEKDPSHRNSVRLGNLHGIDPKDVGKIVKRDTGVGVEQRRKTMLCRHPRLNRFRIEV